MKIAVLTHDGSANSAYRAVLPMQELSRRGHQVAFAQIDGPQAVPTVAALRSFDVVLFWRLFYPPIWRLARRLGEAGIGVVWDNDDDLTALPKTSPAYAQYGGSRAHRALVDIKAMMRAAHVVTTPSAGLAARLEALRDGPVTVVENYLARIHPAGHPRRDFVSVGWAASLEHRQDYDRSDLADVFRRLLAEHPELVLMSIGVRLGFREGERYFHASAVSFDDLPRCLTDFDIGIAPLLDIPFNRARSNIKLKEYAASGVPWLASDVGPYRGIGEAQGGRLVGEGEWHRRLGELIEDARLRKRLGAQGAKWAKTQTIAANVQQWEAVLQEARELAVADRSPTAVR